MCLWPGNYLHHDTAKHSSSGVVKEWTGEWNGALLSSVMRVGSICMRVWWTYTSMVLTWWSSSSGVHSPMKHRLQGVGAISSILWSHLVFLQDKVNSVRYIAQVVNPMLLSFLQQEGDVLFQQDNTRPHTAAATQRALCGIQQLSWPARSSDLLPIVQVQDMMKHCQTVTTGARCRMTFGTFMIICMQEYRPTFLPEGATHCDVCSIWSNFIIIFSYNDKLPVTSIFNTMNLSFKVLHFFSGSVHLILRNYDLINTILYKYFTL